MLALVQSSLRRQAQLLHVRPDLKVEVIRGNVQTRLSKIETEKLDGVILAQAGLKRLGLDDQITQVFKADEMIPAVGQGALAIECRADDTEMLEMLALTTMKLHAMLLKGNAASCVN